MSVVYTRSNPIVDCAQMFARPNVGPNVPAQMCAQMCAQIAPKCVPELRAQIAAAKLM